MIQYPKNVHVTLPDVQGYSTNLGIKKEAHKSIHTRKKTYVGSNNDLLNLMSNSDDRILENINVYQRGINPFVSVQMNNNTSSSTESYYPYRIMKDGAFRFPLQSPKDLLPLSRLPSKVSNYQTNIQNIQYSNAYIDNNTINTSIRKDNYVCPLQTNLKDYVGYYPLNSNNIESHIIQSYLPYHLHSSVNDMVQYKHNNHIISLLSKISPTQMSSPISYTSYQDVKSSIPIKLNPTSYYDIQSNLQLNSYQTPLQTEQISSHIISDPLQGNPVSKSNKPLEINNIQTHSEDYIISDPLQGNPVCNPSLPLKIDIVNTERPSYVNENKLVSKSQTNMSTNVRYVDLNHINNSMDYVQSDPIEIYPNSNLSNKRYEYIPQESKDNHIQTHRLQINPNSNVSTQEKHNVIIHHNEDYVHKQIPQKIIQTNLSSKEQKNKIETKNQHTYTIERPIQLHANTNIKSNIQIDNISNDVKLKPKLTNIGHFNNDGNIHSNYFLLRPI